MASHCCWCWSWNQRRILLMCFIYPWFYCPRNGILLSILIYKYFIIHNAIPGILKLFSLSGDSFHFYTSFLMKRVYIHTSEAMPKHFCPKYYSGPCPIRNPISWWTSQCFLQISKKWHASCAEGFNVLILRHMKVSVVQKVKDCVMSQKTNK